MTANFIDLFTSSEAEKIQQALTLAKDHATDKVILHYTQGCLLYTSPSPRDRG